MQNRLRMPLQKYFLALFIDRVIYVTKKQDASDL